MITKTEHSEKLLQLKKKVELVSKNLGLIEQTCEIITALDVSGSMDAIYRNGKIQNLTDRLMAIGLHFDKNKSIDVYGFGTKVHLFPPATENNIFQYVENNIYPKTSLEGGTLYSSVMKKIIYDNFPDVKEKIIENHKGFLSNVFYKKKQNLKYMKIENKVTIPTLVLFITDGENQDHSDTEDIIIKSSSLPIFWQFVGIGNDDFIFLQRLDTINGRFIDNVNFFSCKDINSVSDDILYTNLFKEFSSWLKLAKEKGIIL